MNSTLRIPLHATRPQFERLQALQQAFAQACNSLAPVVQQSRCWNRVALHHMAYRPMRAQYPELGSQMICNAIYSVSRTSRHVYQSPASPFNLQRLEARPLPLLRFQPDSPVFFDRHTLSLKPGQISLLTLEGRLQFHLTIPEEIEQRFRLDHLREIVLKQQGADFVLDFTFGKAAPAADPVDDLPEYVLVTDDPHLPLRPEAARTLNP